MLVTRAGLQEGEWVLLWGIGSGVSTAALAIANALGANTIVTSSSDEKLARARELGADAAVNHATEDVVARVKELTGGGAHVVVEHVGEDDLVALAQRGPRRRPHRRLRRDERARTRRPSCTGSGGSSSRCSARRWARRADFESAYDLVKSGRALPVIDSVFPLAEAQAAHERLESGDQLGKVLLRIPE